MLQIETLRPDIETPPPRMQHLPVFRGYPVPWFVAFVDGVPEFRAADQRKFIRAIRENRCWVCGEVLGRFKTFVIGPMCGINRTTAEPPCHKECAVYSVRFCPFLSKPQMTRRENDLPDGTQEAGGFSIKRNPGCTLLWSTLNFQLFGDGSGGTLIQIGEPDNLEWWSQGRKATRGEVAESVHSGLPILANMCSGEDDYEELHKRTKWLEERFPK